MARKKEDTAHWHLDKRVPVAIIIAIIIQTAGIIWWAAGIEYRVQSVERSSVRMDALDSRQRESENIASRIDERLRAVVEAIARIERALLPR